MKNKSIFPTIFGFGILMWLSGHYYVPSAESGWSIMIVPLILFVLGFFFTSLAAVTD